MRLADWLTLLYRHIRSSIYVWTAFECEYNSNILMVYILHVVMGHTLKDIGYIKQLHYGESAWHPPRSPFCLATQLRVSNYIGNR